jgi:hypothetical protein
MFTHDPLYDFWSRSQGMWFSKLVNLTMKLLDSPELLATNEIDTWPQPEFGIKLSWQYNTKPESGQMFWWVNSDLSGLIFTDRGIRNDLQPATYNYQMPSQSTLVTTVGKFEETNILDGSHRRLRELRFDGKLMRRHWEHKFQP